nr:type II toxin-antitoxin system RelE/ParE family toxin [Catenulispora pinisilvae]
MTRAHRADTPTAITRHDNGVAAVVRIVYTVDNGELVVWVVRVGHRSTVYDT